MSFRLQPCVARRGLTLLEVLISMGIMLVGLLGIAAMFPAGRLEVKQGAIIDHAGAVGRQAFRDLKIRGFLNPNFWSGGNNPFPTVAIDPLGLGNNFLSQFPADGNLKRPGIPARPVFERISPNNAAVGGLAAADVVFRSSDDLVLTANAAAKDSSPIQQLFVDTATPPNPLKRASEGNYTWLATVVSDPASPGIQGKVIVSVAVFYKRDLSSPPAAITAVGERTANAVLLSTGNNFGLGGGEISLDFAGVSLTGVKPGQWIMLEGRPIVGSNFRFLWYRVVAAQPVGPTGNQSATLAGPDWNNAGISFIRAYIFDNLVAVYEKNMRLEIP